VKFDTFASKKSRRFFISLHSSAENKNKKGKVVKEKVTMFDFDEKKIFFFFAPFVIKKENL
jgi:hypothetical protein